MIDTIAMMLDYWAHVLRGALAWLLGALIGTVGPAR